MKKIIIAMGFMGIFAGSTAFAFAGYFNTTPLASCDSVITRTLQVGSQNNDVYRLQQMLSLGGYLSAQPNGYFGPATRAAVKRFQLDNNISATGQVGEITRNAVNERLCDVDVRGDTLSYDGYSSGYYSSGTTYVDPYDAFVRVISPTPANPTLYSTPPTHNTPISNVATVTPRSSYSTGYSPSVNLSTNSNVLIPSNVNSTTQIASTNIIYSPSLGYTYGIVPQSGSLTISTPVANTTYNEGDTVYLAWTTNNINASGYNVLLENTSTGQSKILGFSSNTSASFVLTKEILDAVCVGACDNNQQGSFRIVITTPVTDIAGTTSTLRAAISPITIKRPYSTVTSITMTASKMPVNSGEEFRLYVNIPSSSSWNVNVYGNSVIKLRAICINNVQVSIAGVPCGQDFSMPVSTMISQQGIPVMITNTTWYSQDISFEASVFNLSGQVVGTATTKVTSSPAPFHW